MAFDKVFQGDPTVQDVAAPGSHQSPSFGVDVVNKELYISAGNGWEVVSVGSGNPGGSTSEIQFNNAASFAGASGGTTNGTHFAFGAGSTIDSVPTGDGSPSASIVVVTETNNNSSTENGLFVGLTLDPSASQTAFPTAIKIQMDMNGNNWTQGGAAFQANANYSGTGTGASALPTMFAFDCGITNTSSGEVQTAFGMGAAVANNGTGRIDNATNAQFDIYNNSVGGMANATNVDVYFETNAGTIDEANGINVNTPVLTNGSTITLRRGLYIQEQNASGVGTVYQLFSEGTSLSSFAGPVELPYTKAKIVYSAAGTPIVSAATAGVGARAFVSDATANTFGTAYTSGGANKVPVWSDGTGWFIG